MAHSLSESRPELSTCPKLRPPPPAYWLPTGAESFGLFSCVINGEEHEQSHRAIFR